MSISDAVHSQEKSQQFEAIPADMRPGYNIGQDGGSVTLLGDSDFTNAGIEEAFKAMGLDPEAWVMSDFRKSKWQRSPDVWLQSLKISVRPKNIELAEQIIDFFTIDQAIQERNKNVEPTIKRLDYGSETVVGVLADLQIGKTDVRGGTEELLERVEASLKNWEYYLRTRRPREIFLLDGGDSIENFENTAQQARTNDRSLTDQIFLWGNIYWKAVDIASRYAETVHVGAVGSNHTRVRKGKDVLGPPTDDFGIMVIKQLAEKAKIAPNLYGHVKFHWPDTWEESICLETIGGKKIGLVHGHQVNQAEKLHEWWAKQSHGRTPVGEADILIAGHFHNLRITSSGDNRWLMVAPSCDNGSSWYHNLAGVESDPGVLTFSVDETGWFDLVVC